MKTVLFLPYPPSVNAIFADKMGGGRVKTAAYKRWIVEAGWTVLSQADSRNRHTGKVRFTMEIRRPDDNRRRDKNNLVKAVEDLLVRQRIIGDDSLIEESLIRWVYDGFEGARVTIEEINDA